MDPENTTESCASQSTERKRPLSSADRQQSLAKKVQLTDITNIPKLDFDLEEKKGEMSEVNMLSTDTDTIDTAVAASSAAAVLAVASVSPGSASSAGSDPQMNDLQLIMSKLSVLETISVKLDKLNKIETDMSEMKTTVNNYKHSLDKTQEQLSEALETIDILEGKTRTVDIMREDMQLLKQKNVQLEKKILAMESYSRRQNLIIEGWEEQKKENCFQIAHSLFQKLKVPPKPLEMCHRLGQYRQKQATPRKIILRFTHVQDKISVMKEAGELKGTRIFIKDDLPVELEQQRQSLWPVYKLAKSIDKSASLKKDKIHFNGHVYNMDNLSLMPVDFDKISIKETDNEVLFAGEHTPLSNWYRCDLNYMDSVFPSCEHLYQYRKAGSLGHHDIADQIRTAPTPRMAMMIGKAAKGSADWQETMGREIMKECVEEKLSQVPRFKQELLRFRNKKFAEATRNLIWGTGIPLADKETDATDKSEWKGKNILGEIYNEIVKSF